MKMAIFLILLVGGLLSSLAWFPIETSRVHTSNRIMLPGDVSSAWSFTAVRRITTPPEAILKAADRTIRQLPRTEVLAGSIDEGLVTYVTRSAVFRFPDFVTVETLVDETGPLLNIRSRSRIFGYDWGVNQARVETVLRQLGPLVVPAS